MTSTTTSSLYSRVGSAGACTHSERVTSAKAAIIPLQHQSRQNRSAKLTRPSFKGQGLSCSRRCFTVASVSASEDASEADSEDESLLGNADIPAAPIFIPEGPWTVVEDGGVTTPAGFKAAGIYAGLRSSGTRPDLALLVADEPAVVGGTFTQNVVCAAPVTYCKQILKEKERVRAVLCNAGQANAATGQWGWADAVMSAEAASSELQMGMQEILLESTGVIGKRIKMKEMLAALPELKSQLGSDPRSGLNCATAMTTTDLASKSTALKMTIGGKEISIGGCSKGSGMIHPNMATMLGLVTSDVNVEPTLWRSLVKTASIKSFNQITVDGDTSTNDCVLALASGAAGNELISDPESEDAKLLEKGLIVLLQALAKCIAWDGEGATVLLECEVVGAANDFDAERMSKAVVGSSLVKSAVFGRDPNWGRIAAAVGYSGATDWNPDNLRIQLGDTLLMEDGQPLDFEADVASNYMKEAGEIHGTVKIKVSVGDGPGQGFAWGCDLSYQYVTINAEYHT